jgi:hypothetical protein
LDNSLSTDDVEIRFMLTRERSGDTILVHRGGAYSRGELGEAVALFQLTGWNFLYRAYIKAKKPVLGDKCKVVRIEFTNRKSVVNFANGIDNLSF